MTELPGIPDPAVLAGWMDSQHLGSGPIANGRLLAGGTQNIVLLFERSRRRFVLRRPSLHPRPGAAETIKREARILAALSGSGVPHPAFIASGDESVLGVFFYLMEEVQGFNPATGLASLHAASDKIRERMGFALVDGLCTLGTLDFRELNLGDFGRPEQFLQRQAPRWRTQLESYAAYEGWSGAAALGDVEGVGRWLEANCPDEFTPGIVHGDFHIANTMFRYDSGELAAIIDWELATIGDPLIDLGWLIATWPDPELPNIAAVQVKPWQGFPDARQLIAHYAAQSARDLASFVWYAVLACYKLGILLEGTFARSAVGKAPRSTGELLHADAVSLFQRAERWIKRPTW